MPYWDGERRLGLRWNGGDESAVGSPQSQGRPTWFIVPALLAATLRSKIQETHDRELADGYSDMAADARREAEAGFWCGAGLETEVTKPR